MQKMRRIAPNAIQAKLKSYNNCNGVWRFGLGHPGIHTESETVYPDDMKLVCCPFDPQRAAASKAAKGKKGGGGSAAGT